METYRVSRENRFELSSTSKGNQRKWVNDGKFLKADTMGYEGIAEVLASEVEAATDGIEYVNYSLCLIQEDDLPPVYGCVSDIFLKEEENIVTVDRLVSRYAGSLKSRNKLLKQLTGKELVNTIADICSQLTSLQKEDIMCYFSDIVKLDALFLNEDRHINNISFTKLKDGSYKFSPIFDNGLSFLSDTVSYPLVDGISDLVRKVKAKPFNKDFISQIEYFSDYGLLSINTDKLYSRLEEYKVEFKEEEYQRACKILRQRLNLLKGVAWE